MVELPETGNILVIDDSPSMRAMVSFTLHEHGYQVKEAENGADALTQLDEACSPYDLIIADVNMPKMDGIDFVRQARTRPAYKYTPVIMLTTETASERIESARSAGATAWLVKPFQPDRLLEVAKRLID